MLTRVLEILAPGLPDEFLDDFAVQHNIQGDEEFQGTDERERVLDEVLSEAASEANESFPQTKKMNHCLLTRIKTGIDNLS